MTIKHHILSGIKATALLFGITSSALAVDLEFYFPVAVGGKAADTIKALTDEYVAANEGVNIDAVYSGSYKETVTKALTASRGGKPPQLSVILSVDMFTLIDEEVIMPFDELIESDEDKAWLQSFYPAFMENSQTGGKPTVYLSSAQPRCCIGTRRPSPRSVWTLRHLLQPGKRPSKWVKTGQKRRRWQRIPLGRQNSFIGFPLLAVSRSEHTE